MEPLEVPREPKSEISKSGGKAVLESMTVMLGKVIDIPTANLRVINSAPQKM